MRLGRLTIQNLASIEQADIDFTAPPLDECGVFLITGPTGSGKSTILDAVCLALYGTTPRMAGTSMQGKVSDHGLELQLSDPRQLVRRGSAGAHVTLTFTGTDLVPYRAEWGASRARGRKDGRLQNRTWTLTDLRTGLTLSRDSEVSKGISAAVGLDFRQFCRTTMLAQGEFTKFLNSKDDEKAVILEKITGMDIYSKVGASIYRTFSKRKETYETLKRQLGDTAPLDSNEREIHLRRRDEISGSVKMLREQRAQADTKIKWLKDMENLADELTKAQENLGLAERQMEDESYKSLCREISDWNSTSKVRETCQMRDAHAALVADSDAGFTPLREEYALLLGDIQWETAELGRRELLAEKLRERTSSQAGRADAYAKRDAVTAYLERILENTGTIRENSRKAQEEEKRKQTKLLPYKNRVNESLKKADEDFSRQSKLIESLQEQASGTDLSLLRSRHDSLQDDKDEMIRAIRDLEIFLTLRENEEKRLERISVIDEETGRLKSQAENVSEELHDAKLILNERQRARDRQHDSVESWARDIRARLRVGDICPVCQSRVEVIPDESLIDFLAKAAEDEYAEAYGKCEALRSSSDRIQASIMALQKERDMHAGDGSSHDRLEQSRQKAASWCARYGLSEADSSALKNLSEREALLKSEISEVSAAVSSAEKAEERIRTEMKVLDKIRKEREKLAADLEAASKDIEAVDSELRSLRLLEENLTAQNESDFDKTESLLAGSSDWSSDLRSDPAAFKAEFIRVSDAYHADLYELDLIEEKLREDGEKLEKIKDTAGKIGRIPEMVNGTVTPVFREYEGDRNERADTLLSEVISLSGAKAANMRNLEADRLAVSSYLSREDAVSAERLEELCCLSEDAVEALVSKKEETEQRCKECRTKLEDISRRIDEHRSACPDIGQSDTIGSLMESVKEYEAQTECLNQEKGRIDQIIENDDMLLSRIESLRVQVEDSRAEFERWGRINDLIGDSTGSKFRKIAQSYVLSSLVRAANRHMVTLSGRYRLSVAPGTFVISVEDAYQGYASRPASTISGGESFLVSLALALALAELGQRLSVSTLFIDEGFGTLSGEPLQNAIDTLRSLHGLSGRNVGIISHVEEIREKIPVQIRLTQEGRSSSSSVSVIP